MHGARTKNFPQNILECWELKLAWTNTYKQFCTIVCIFYSSTREYVHWMRLWLFQCTGKRVYTKWPFWIFCIARFCTYNKIGKFKLSNILWLFINFGKMYLLLATTIPPSFSFWESLFNNDIPRNANPNRPIEISTIHWNEKLCLITKNANCMEARLRQIRQFRNMYEQYKLC